MLAREISATVFYKSGFHQFQHLYLVIYKYFKFHISSNISFTRFVRAHTARREAQDMLKLVGGKQIGGVLGVKLATENEREKAGAGIQEVRATEGRANVDLEREGAVGVGKEAVRM
jgi:hypothetical protein